MMVANKERQIVSSPVPFVRDFVSPDVRQFLETPVYNVSVFV
jgi:hypothetical protein